MWHWNLQGRRIQSYVFYCILVQLTQIFLSHFKKMFLKKSCSPKSSQSKSCYTSLTMWRAKTMASSLHGMVKKFLGNLSYLCQITLACNNDTDNKCQTCTQSKITIDLYIRIKFIDSFIFIKTCIQIKFMIVL